jgi:hypothetical protein
LACFACFDGDAGVRDYAGLEYAESLFEKLMRNDQRVSTFLFINEYGLTRYIYILAFLVLNIIKHSRVCCERSVIPHIFR